MTGIVKQQPQPDRVFQRFGGGLLPATLGEAVRATVGDPLLSPSELVVRRQELQEEAGEVLNPSVSIHGGIDTFEPPKADISELVSPEELNAEFGDLGVSFDRPTRRRVAEMLAEQKLEERIREDVLRRAPSGILPTTAVFGAALVRAALDPLNVAAAFVPVVSQARYAGLVARVGTTGARFSKGFVEGVVGNALIEPGVAVLARQQQLDYTMADALLNVSLGGIIGGGFHVGAGKVGDFLTRARPETREAALRGAVAQAVQGKRVDVDPIVQREREELGRAFDQVRRDPVGPADDPLVRLRPEALEDVLVERGPAFREGKDIIVRGREVGRLFGTRAGFGLAKVIIRHGERSKKAPALQIGRSDITALPDVLREFEPSRVIRDDDGNIVGQDYRVTLPHERFGPRDVVFGVRKFTDGDGENRLVTAFVVDPDVGVSFPASQRRTGEGAGSPGLGFKPEARDTAAEAFDRLSQGQAPSPADPNVGRNGEEINDVARRESSPERDATADFEASRSADEVLQEAPAEVDETSAQAEADFLAEQVQDLRRQGLLDPGLEPELDALNELVDQAESLSRATKSAALCLTRP